MQKHLIPISTLIILLLLVACSSEPTPMQHKEEAQHKLYLAFGGGPTGGTFNFFANKMATIISASDQQLNISPTGSGGSVENLRSLNNNGVDLGIVYSGDAFLGRQGALPNDMTQYTNVRSLSFLYGAPAQLVVAKDSGINTPADLVGKKVALGNPGSGAALSAERFFKHLGIWSQIIPMHLGYSQAAHHFVDNKIDAFWVLVGYPNTAVIQASAAKPIRLLDLDKAAQDSGLYTAFPFYKEIQIPANVYNGQKEAVNTFQDASMWCASSTLDATTVYRCMQAIYSDNGLSELAKAHTAAQRTTLENGLQGISIPLHPGAVQFWKEHGVDIPAELIP